MFTGYFVQFLSVSREPATSLRIQDFIMAGGCLGLINYDYPVQKLERISIYDDPTTQKTSNGTCLSRTDSGESIVTDIPIL